MPAAREILTPTAEGCPGCQQRDREIRQLQQEFREELKAREALADLAVKQKRQLAKVPADPVRLARLLVKQHSDAFLDAMTAEIVRLKQ